MTCAHGAVIACALLAACRADARSTGASAAAGAAGATAASSPSAPNVAGGPCYLREVWDECGLIKRLENSGYVPKVKGRDPASVLKPFTAPYLEITLGRGKLHAFIYPTAQGAAAELARADTAGQGVCPPPRTATYGGTLLHSANLIAFLEADNDNTCARITDLVLAGLPKLERKERPRRDALH